MTGEVPGKNFLAVVKEGKGAVLAKPALKAPSHGPDFIMGGPWCDPRAMLRDTNTKKRNIMTAPTKSGQGDAGLLSKPLYLTPKQFAPKVPERPKTANPDAANKKDESPPKRSKFVPHKEIGYYSDIVSSIGKADKTKIPPPSRKVEKFDRKPDPRGPWRVTKPKDRIIAPYAHGLQPFPDKTSR